MALISDKIKNIDVDNKKSWNNKAYLTFDIDWAHDEILKYTIELVESYDVYATWFVTHKTPLIQRLRENPKFELGIHPNFNNLLKLKTSNGSNCEEIIGRLMDYLPDAKSVRSHSVTQNSPILDYFKISGLSHDCNHFIPYQAEIVLKPWKLWNGLIKCPYFWEDDIDCLFNDLNIEKTFSCSGMKIYDFHPIHVFLNTEKLDRYENSRVEHQNPSKLKNYIHDGYGTQDQLIKLLQNIS